MAGRQKEKNSVKAWRFHRVQCTFNQLAHKYTQTPGRVVNTLRGGKTVRVPFQLWSLFMKSHLFFGPSKDVIHAAPCGLVSLMEALQPQLPVTTPAEVMKDTEAFLATTYSHLNFRWGKVPSTFKRVCRNTSRRLCILSMITFNPNRLLFPAYRTERPPYPSLGNPLLSTKWENFVYLAINRDFLLVI